MLLVGILIYLLHRNFGHYYVEGVGYSTVQAIVFGQLDGAWLLALLFVCKLSRRPPAWDQDPRVGSFRPPSLWARRSAAPSLRL